MSNTFTEHDAQQFAPAFERFLEHWTNNTDAQANVFTEKRTPLVLEAMEKGFLYDAEGNVITSPDTLAIIQSEWEQQHPQHALSLPPLFFRNPADESGRLYCLRESGSIGGVRNEYYANDLLDKSFRIRVDQQTEEVPIPEMGPFEKFLNLISFFQWKPARIRQAERRNDVSRMERMKIAEKMGYPIDAAEKAKYAELWNLTAAQKEAYISNKELPEAEAVVVPAPQQQTVKDRLEESNQRRITDFKNEIDMVKAKLEEREDLKEDKYRQGVETLKTYLDHCKANPDPKQQREAVNMLMLGLTGSNEAGGFGTFVENMGRWQLSNEQVEAVLKMPSGFTFKSSAVVSPRMFEALVTKADQQKKAEQPVNDDPDIQLNNANF